jgi:phenylacetic acid degradation operon negative regulatory protein
MTRLRREGWFVSEKTGREVCYRLNEKSWRLLDDGRTRIFERPFEEWNRTWTQALLGADIDNRDRRKRITTALRWCGFGSYSGTSWFSPHDRAKRLREMLTGDDELHIQLLTSQTAGLPGDRLIADRCWDLSNLGVDYQMFIQTYQPQLRRFRRGLSGADALRERTQLIQEYRRYPFRDPDLPEELLPLGWRGRAANEVFLEAHEALRNPAEAFVTEVTGQYIDSPDI